jgi:hypothetical protein
MVVISEYHSFNDLSPGMKVKVKALMLEEGNPPLRYQYAVGKVRLNEFDEWGNYKSKDKKDRLKRSIRRYGYRKNSFILFDKTGRRPFLDGGRHRVQAVRELEEEGYLGKDFQFPAIFYK